MKIHAWEVIVQATDDGAEVLTPYSPEPLVLKAGERVKFTIQSALDVAQPAVNERRRSRERRRAERWR